LPDVVDSRPLRLGLVLPLHIAQGVPLGLFHIAIPAWLSANGASALAVGAFLSATSLPSTPGWASPETGAVQLRAWWPILKTVWAGMVRGPSLLLLPALVALGAVAGASSALALCLTACAVGGIALLLANRRLDAIGCSGS
jgi:hypothetical protein